MWNGLMIFFVCVPCLENKYGYLLKEGEPTEGQAEIGISGKRKRGVRGEGP